MAGPSRRKVLARDVAVFMKDTAGRGNWGHPGMAAVLKGISVEEATWKPAPDAHSIWEEVNHIAHWSRHVLDRLDGRGERTQQAWPAGADGAARWRRAVAGVTRLHAAMTRRIASIDDATLAANYASTRYTMAQLVLGCVSHVAYHVGQIAVLKRLYRHASRSA